MENRRLDYLLIQTRIKMILQKVTKKKYVYIFNKKKLYFFIYEKKNTQK